MNMGAQQVEKLLGACQYLGDSWAVLELVRIYERV